MCVCVCVCVRFSINMSCTSNNYILTVVSCCLDASISLTLSLSMCVCVCVCVCYFTISEQIHDTIPATLLNPINDSLSLSDNRRSSTQRRLAPGSLPSNRTRHCWGTMTTTINTSSAADLDSGERCPVSKMDTGETSIGDINDGRPILHRRTNGGQGTNENRPKSGKILVRKNTPALLPKVDKIYGEWLRSDRRHMLWPFTTVRRRVEGNVFFKSQL